MADTTVSAFTRTMSLSAGDIVPVVVDPDSAPTNKAITVGDLQTAIGGGGGGSALPLDAAPSSSHVSDDEFIGTSLDAKWTLGPTSNPPTATVAGGFLHLAPSVANKRAYFVWQEAPTGDFAVAAKISAPLGGQRSDFRPGILVARTANTKALIYGLGLSGGPNKAMWIEHSNYSETTDWGAFNGSWSNNQFGAYGGGFLWFRARWVSASSTLFFDLSADGITWADTGLSRTFLQPDRVGLCLQNNSANQNVNDTLNVEWFRVTE